MRYRLHVPGATTPAMGSCDDRRTALVDAVKVARNLALPVHVIDTRPGGGLVTVIGAPGSWDGRWCNGALLDEALA